MMPRAHKSPAAVARQPPTALDVLAAEEEGGVEQRWRSSSSRLQELPPRIRIYPELAGPHSIVRAQRFFAISKINADTKDAGLTTRHGIGPSPYLSRRSLKNWSPRGCVLALAGEPIKRHRIEDARYDS